MAKQNSGKDPSRSDVERGAAAPTRLHTTEVDFVNLLLDIQNRISSSPALNGGFDTLLAKVDKIEESQTQIAHKVEKIESNQEAIASKVDSVHDAIYDANNGLFVRVADVKTSQAKERSELDKQIIGFEAWKDQHTKTKEEEDVETKKTTEIQLAHQKAIDSLVSWKDTVSSVAKWVGVALGGGTVSLIFKVIYDLLHAKGL
jgi:uncharacterized phage infection (PIP) family protein YhgE